MITKRMFITDDFAMVIQYRLFGIVVRTTVIETRLITHGFVEVVKA